eukprot:TRINITY_DN49146_c0_g1_i1.p1 TRINITY_DN49146_c0_g1~~TRINITY_DN49146_c0_g1_i1.p1  ORF type:complete len:574 (+),score=24.08 TRINITY_DN49146_c0_g1_i1:31-1752(+)
MASLASSSAPAPSALTVAPHCTYRSYLPKTASSLTTDYRCEWPFKRNHPASMTATNDTTEAPPRRVPVSYLQPAATDTGVRQSSQWERQMPHEAAGFQIKQERDVNQHYVQPSQHQPQQLPGSASMMAHNQGSNNNKDIPSGSMSNHDGCQGRKRNRTDSNGNQSKKIKMEQPETAAHPSSSQVAKPKRKKKSGTLLDLMRWETGGPPRWAIDCWQRNTFGAKNTKGIKRIGVFCQQAFRTFLDDASLSFQQFLLELQQCANEYQNEHTSSQLLAVLDNSGRIPREQRNLWILRCIIPFLDEYQKLERETGQRVAATGENRTQAKRTKKGGTVLDLLHWGTGKKPPHWLVACWLNNTTSIRNIKGSCKIIVRCHAVFRDALADVSMSFENFLLELKNCTVNYHKAEAHDLLLVALNNARNLTTEHRNLWITSCIVRFLEEYSNQKGKHRPISTPSCSPAPPPCSQQPSPTVPIALCTEAEMRRLVDFVCNWPVELNNKGHEIPANWRLPTPICPGRTASRCALQFQAMLRTYANWNVEHVLQLKRLITSMPWENVPACMGKPEAECLWWKNWF